MALGVASSAAYGVAMGSFPLFGGHGALQCLYSAIKMPALLAVTFLLTMPAFYMINMLAGLAADWRKCTHALAEAQFAVGLALVSLSPLTVFWYVNCTHYILNILFNSLMFTLASLAAHQVLLRRYRPLIAVRPRHRWMLRIWLVSYAFVGIQMGWTLRPFIGSPGGQAVFLRWTELDNAYVTVFKMILGLLRGGRW